MPILLAALLALLPAQAHADDIHIPEGVCMDPRGCELSSDSGPSSSGWSGSPPDWEWGRKTAKAGRMVRECGSKPLCILVRASILYPLGLAMDAPFLLAKGLVWGGYYGAKGVAATAKGVGRGVSYPFRAAAESTRRAAYTPVRGCLDRPATGDSFADYRAWEACKRDILARQRAYTKRNPSNKANEDWCRGRIPLATGPNRAAWEKRCNPGAPEPASANAPLVAAPKGLVLAMRPESGGPPVPVSVLAEAPPPAPSPVPSPAPETEESPATPEPEAAAAAAAPEPAAPEARPEAAVPEAVQAAFELPAPASEPAAAPAAPPPAPAEPAAKAAAAPAKPVSPTAAPAETPVPAHTPSAAEPDPRPVRAAACALEEVSEDLGGLGERGADFLARLRADAAALAAQLAARPRPTDPRAVEVLTAGSSELLSHGKTEYQAVAQLAVQRIAADGELHVDLAWSVSAPGKKERSGQTLLFLAPDGSLKTPASRRLKRCLSL